MDQQYLDLKSFNLPDMVDESIKLLRECEPHTEYYGAFSGGKDSVVIKELAKMAGVKVTWHYNVTTIDPPELVRFIKREHPEVVWQRNPKGTFFNRMMVRGFPTRRQRWCCEEFKERRSPPGAAVIIGVRGEESKRRARTWTDVTYAAKGGGVYVSPILRWKSSHVWQFIHANDVPYCSLYDEGFERLGCIGCPMSRESGRLAAFRRWPGYEKQWRRAFRLLWNAKRHLRGFARFRNHEHMWEWWLSNDKLPPGDDGDDCQQEMWS